MVKVCILEPNLECNDCQECGYLYDEIYDDYDELYEEIVKNKRDARYKGEAII